MPRKSDSLVQRFDRFVRLYNLIASGDKVVVAVSGGPDSLCLLHLLLDIKPKLGFDIIVAHLDHRLRPASAADAVFVFELAESLGLPAIIEARDIAAYRKDHRLSLEAAAREVRYHFLAETAARFNCRSVAVGHTSSDHAETVLLHLIRGTGIAGLVGLKGATELNVEGFGRLRVIRPLLCLSHAAVLGYLQDKNQSYLVDESNADTKFGRNRIRHELVPLLESFNPAIEKAIERLSRVAADEMDFTRSMVDIYADFIVRRERDGYVLDKAAMQNLASPGQRELLRRLLGQLKGDPQDFEMVHIEAILSSLDKPVSTGLNLPGGILFKVEYGSYYLGRKPDNCRLPELDGRCCLTVPGGTVFSGWRINAQILTPKDAEALDTGNAFSAYLDADVAGEMLTVRSRKSGDRFRPLGLTESKSLKEFFIDAKVPQAHRARVPLVISLTGEVAWVVGQRINEQYKVTSKTSKVLWLEFELPTMQSA